MTGRLIPNSSEYHTKHALDQGYGVAVSCPPFLTAAFELPYTHERLCTSPTNNGLGDIFGAA